MSEPVKHTPGPWVIRYGMQGYPRSIEAPHQNHVKGGIGAVVRWNGIGFPSSAEARANCALIAAAPDLLEALKLAQTIIGHPDDCGSQIIADAIAKAEGRS